MAILGVTASPDMIKLNKEKHKKHKEKQNEIRKREMKIYDGKTFYSRGKHKDAVF